MTDHKEILRLKSLGLSNTDIARACGCGRNTVTRTLQRADQLGTTWHTVHSMPSHEVTEKLFPHPTAKAAYRMAAVHHFRQPPCTVHYGNGAPCDAVWLLLRSGICKQSIAEKRLRISVSVKIYGTKISLPVIKRSGILYVSFPMEFR